MLTAWQTCGEELCFLSYQRDMLLLPPAPYLAHKWLVAYSLQRPCVALAVFPSRWPIVLAGYFRSKEALLVQLAGGGAPWHTASRIPDGALHSTPLLQARARDLLVVPHGRRAHVPPYAQAAHLLLYQGELVPPVCILGTRHPVLGVSLC